jgi:tetratricopeptide (TPR) repeat protein
MDYTMKRTALIFLTLVSMGVYWNTLPNQFVAGDRQFILRNPQIGNFATVTNAFTADYWGKLGGESFIYYRPVTIFSHFIDFTLYGLSPGGHHFSNMIFHTIVTLLVFQLFLYLFAPRLLIPLIGASLFALHPIHTHSVSYVMGRTDILAALFFLGGFILLIGVTGKQTEDYRRLKIMGACLCYLTALLCKEIAVTLPLIFILYWFCWGPDQRSFKDSRFITPFFSLCFTLSFYLALRILAVGLLSSEGAIPSWYSLWQRVCLVIITCGFYLQKLLLPIKLCYYSNLFVPDSWQTVVLSSFFWTGILLIVSFAISLKRSPQVGFALGWTGITLLPVINIILIPTLAKENFLYLPSIGFCLLLCLLIHFLSKEVRNSRTVAFSLSIAGSIVVGFLYGGTTFQRNTDYREPIIFLESTLRNMAPVPYHLREDVCYFEGVKNFFVTYRNLGILYQKCGQWQKSAQAFENALGYTPSYFCPNYASAVKVPLAESYAQTGRLHEAATLLLEARSTSDNPSKIDNFLGVIAINLKEKEKAAHYFKRALLENKNYAPAHHNLGILYMESDQTEEGLVELLEAAKLNPQYKKTLFKYGQVSASSQ